MRIARFTLDGSTRLGLVDGDRLLDAGGADPGLPTDVEALLAARRLEALRRAADGARTVPLADVRLEAPIARPPELLAVGLNYADHIAETAQERPEFPKIFNKQVSCINRPGGPIVIPAAAPAQVDYEGELGIVIGTACRAVSPDDAWAHIAGYLIVNDVSVRDWQKASPTMTMGKSWDSHGPIGPWVVTADELDDPGNLRIRTWVDDELRQDDTTASMIHGCAELVSFLSTAFTLLPGTIIATGTPAGVGMAMNPPGFLRSGQTVRIAIDGIGELVNPVVAEAP